MNEYFFDYLIKLTNKTNKSLDIPVSAIILDQNNKIISSGWNTRNRKQNISCHAEINAINKAIKTVKNLNLSSYKLITTLEPCEMCYGAIKQAHIDKVEYITNSPKYGVQKVYAVNDIGILLTKNSTRVQETKYKKILEEFFEKLR